MLGNVEVASILNIVSILIRVLQDQTCALDSTARHRLNFLFSESNCRRNLAYTLLTRLPVYFLVLTFGSHLLA